MNEHLRDLFDELPRYLGGHMGLSVAALAVGLAVCLPLGVFVSRRKLLAEWVLGAAGVLQTIPSLALLALMVPLLGGAIGFWPAFVAMTLYSLLPLLKNTVTGIQGVDARVVEAARGLGMSERQVLFRVQLPLAAPVILSGVRIATVLVVGSATLATPVGYKTLGNYIFEGLNTRDHLMVVFGCVTAALLAVVLDQLIHLLEVAIDRRRLGLAGAGTAALLLLIAGGLFAPAQRLLRPPTNPVIVATHDYTEQHILAEVLRGSLEPAGFHVEQVKGMAQQVTLDAVCAGSVDCCIDYTGNIWANMMEKAPADRETTLRGVMEYLRDEKGVECLGPIGFENAYRLAMRRADAERLGVAHLGDLARHAGRLKIGGDLQFFRLQEWKQARALYGLTFAEETAMDPTLMYDAIRKGKVDVICAYTSDARVAAYDLVEVPEAPGKRAFPTYDAVLLLSRKAAGRPGLREALLPLVRSIDTERMKQYNGRVDVERTWPRQAGRELLDALRSRPVAQTSRTSVWLPSPPAGRGAGGEGVASSLAFRAKRQVKRETASEEATSTRGAP